MKTPEQIAAIICLAIVGFWWTATALLFDAVDRHNTYKID